jgi:hypothetical protein
MDIAAFYIEIPPFDTHYDGLHEGNKNGLDYRRNGDERIAYHLPLDYMISSVPLQMCQAMAARSTCTAAIPWQPYVTP